MGWGYTLKDFVHDQGLTMGEFKRLDLETQEKWRSIHRRKHREQQIEANRIWREMETELASEKEIDKYE
jgi:hypothetical protein